MGTRTRRLVGISAVLLTAAIAWRCSSGAAAGGGGGKGDVVVELEKLHVPSLPKTFTPEQRAQLQRGWDGKGQWFVKTGCVACHSVSVYDVTALSPVGPDLALAVDDVKTRFGRSLEDFLKEPQGTMQMVLGQLLVLTPEQKTEALQHLHAAFDEYQQRKQAGQAK